MCIQTIELCPSCKKATGRVIVVQDSCIPSPQTCKAATVYFATPPPGDSECVACQTPGCPNNPDADGRDHINRQTPSCSYTLDGDGNYQINNLDGAGDDHVNNTEGHNQSINPPGHDQMDELLAMTLGSSGSRSGPGSVSGSKRRLPRAVSGVQVAPAAHDVARVHVLKIEEEENEQSSGSSRTG